MYYAGAGRVPQRSLLQPGEVSSGLLNFCSLLAPPSSCARAHVRIDDPLITDSLTSVFGNMPAEQPLCPLSRSAFRSRFRALGKGMGLPEISPPAPPRSSVATFLFEVTVARRGRWMSQKTTNIYLQEVQVASDFPRLNVSEKHRILGLYEKGHSITRYATELLQNGIDNNLWPSLFARPPTSDNQNVRLRLLRVVLFWDFGIMGQPLSRAL